jgi:hypothetical protein
METIDDETIAADLGTSCPPDRALGAGFGAAQKVAFADDADKISMAVDDRKAADCLLPTSAPQTRTPTHLASLKERVGSLRLLRS